MRVRAALRMTLALSCASVACASSTPKQPQTGAPADPQAAAAPVKAAREQPPAASTARDIAFPPIHHETLDNGLSLDVVTHKQLPIVSMELVIQSGSTSDPKDLPGLASGVADMLREGTLKKPGARFAEAVEFLGANLHTSAG